MIRIEIRPVIIKERWNCMPQSHDVFARTLNWASNRGLRLWSSEITTSTNSIAKNDSDPQTTPILSPNLDILPQPTLYLARHQTLGRGRGTNQWSSTDGGLLSSWSFRLSKHPQPILAPLIGLALFDAAQDTWNSDTPFNLKAPNDLFIGSKKVAGLLIEIVGTFEEIRLVIGLGMNVSSEPKDVPTATCISHHSAEALAEGRWESFLQTWTDSLMLAVNAGIHSTLQPQAREKLRKALNEHPHLPEEILHVDEFGQLHTPSRVIHWHEL
jgi:BirA family biotin operon repressor/biotin-[acetyl-CoA-carboxylase] ligase